MSVDSGWGRFTWGQAYWGEDTLLATGWGAKSWGSGEWGNLADETVSLTGVSFSSTVGSLTLTGTALVEPTGVSTTSNLGTITNVISAEFDVAGSQFTAQPGSLTIDVSVIPDITGQEITGAIGVIDPADQIVGLTGKSGCGKSTITKLIQGLYRPQSGIVALDNVDLRLLDLSHIRSQVSLVGSDSYFFPGTIRENISKPMPNSSMDRIIWSTKKVFAHDEIEKFPDGYETFLEENASNVSTGMRQKLAIARALIRNPRILILDDAISGFDVDSEIKLYDALPDIALGRTIIIVSNRVWHLRLCNKIFVLDNGKISQQGSFEELTNSPGYFSDTYHKQMSMLGVGGKVKNIKKAV